MNTDVLKRPIQPNEIEWRLVDFKSANTTVVPYIQNRAVMDRFDEAFGASNWQNTFAEWRSVGVKCGIGVYDESRNIWVWKYDGADETNIEATKGGFSDSMKRCAVQWGMGRDLYAYPKVMLEGQHKYIPDWAKNLLDKLVQAIIDGKIDKDLIFLKQPK